LTSCSRADSTFRNYPHQVELFNFVEKYEDELRAYYRNLFEVNLAGKGSDLHALLLPGNG
jgi:hypothetical protein